MQCSMHPGRMVYRPMRMATATDRIPSAGSAPRPAPEAEEVYRRWIQFLDDEFTRHSSPERRNEIVRDQLYQLYLGRPHGGKLNLTLTSELPGNVVSLSLDPENVTLEAQHFADADCAQLNQRKPLLWFWQMFDRSPVGLNHWLGIRFRCMLGRHIFKHVGTGVKIYHGVDLTYGYNLSIGDGVTIRQRALLNDRGGITIGNHAVIGSFARIYSHTHAADNYDRVTLVPTVIGDGARIGSHAIVLAGQNVAAGEAVGSFPTDRI
jgi:acetyltransferase-like isoleucine patch superfamily enzyme